MIRRRTKQNHTIDFELNLASIIDCFTVLITYLLMATSFIAFGALTTGVSIFGPSEEAPQAELDIVVTAKVQGSGKILLLVTGKEKREVVFQSGQYQQLSSELKKLKEKYPTLSNATLTADDDVEYVDMVKTVEAMRVAIPVSILGGFTGP